MTLELEGLTKVYKDKTALDDVSFSFTPGIYGLLGPNGAGKSTMMNLISDNLTPSKGRGVCTFSYCKGLQQGS